MRRGGMQCRCPPIRGQMCRDELSPVRQDRRTAGKRVYERLLDGSSSGRLSPLRVCAAASDVHQPDFCLCCGKPGQVHFPSLLHVELEAAGKRLCDVFSVPTHSGISWFGGANGVKAPRHMSSHPKRVCTENMSAIKIGTHNGTFHCDEVLACFFLRQLPEYKDAEIIRTRDPTKLAECDIVVDVGGEFDPKKHRYDHHQRTFAETFHSLCPEKPWGTKLSSAGLVYLHFGRQLLVQLTQLKEGDRKLEGLFDKLYENFVEEVDAVDNGISQCDGEARYSVSTTLSARVGHLNPRWNSKSQDTEEGFRKAMKLVGEEFLDRLEYYQSAWLPARAVVEEAVKGRHQAVQKSTMCFAPVLTGSEPLATPCPSVRQRVLLSSRRRLSLLEEWRGVRDDALSKLSGIEGCIFVHAGGFIGGNKSQEGALEMARRTLQAAARAPANGSS
ncbi:UPF0160 protein MYG1, mitochondrial [Liparis tanakae]|uniref:UPF0160 protein MYG1, mitochondrial n=1 Tax=Liparis tanakae TaxID=230148 RepID=A0A4Z2IW63_9TELE|nr:UPF0160 protein MYG1, mitochondrial [Liparis tanakae]